MIIYSLLAHESIECANDLILNIKKFTVNPFLIIINLNHELFGKKDEIINDNVIINPNPNDKKWATSDILKGHIDNFNYLNRVNIKFEYFILLASNCMFIRKFDVSKLDLDYTTKITEKSWNPVDIKTKDYWWPIFLKNKSLINIFLKHKIYPEKGSHEGAIYKHEQFEQIINKINELKLFENILIEVPFEEFFLLSLEFYLFGKRQPRICKIYWNNKDWYVKISDIESEISNNGFYMVKRIPRSLNDPVREFIRKLN